IPVGKLTPQKLLDLPARLAKIIGPHQPIHFADQAVVAREDPPVRKRRVDQGRRTKDQRCAAMLVFGLWSLVFRRPPITKLGDDEPGDIQILFAKLRAASIRSGLRLRSWPGVPLVASVKRSASVPC